MPITPQELRERVKRTYDVFTYLLNSYASLSQDAKTQLITGINKSYGQAEAFHMEHMTYAKQQTKGRVVLTQDYADVTSGKADEAFAKSIECKSITDAKSSAVDVQIKKAIKQLAGLTGHQPRKDDVRVIDVKVNCKYNPWPNVGGSYGKPRLSGMTLDVFKRNTILRLKKILDDNNVYGVSNLKSWLSGQNITNLSQIAPLRSFKQKSFPNSTRPVMKNTTGQLFKVRCLTIKVRFDPKYPLKDFGSGVNEIVVQVYTNNTGTGLTIQTVKVKKYVLNSQTFKQELTRKY